MKKFWLPVATLFALVFATSSTFAAIQSATGVRITYSSSPVIQTVWSTLVSSTSKAIKGMTVFHSSQAPVEIGITTAGAATNAETRQFIVAPLQQGFAAPGAVYYPIAISQSMRVSVRAIGSSAITGEGDFNFFYN